MLKRSFLLFVSLLLTAGYALASGLDGSWHGKIMLNPEMGLRLVINIAGSEGDAPSVTMDSPDQGAYGLPMQIGFMRADSFNVTIPQIGLHYTGKLDGDSIVGQFRQGPLAVPLTLRAVAEALSRPQTPVPPFPYTVVEVTFPSALDNATLYGTLTIPAGVDPTNVPAVLLVSGSGTQNRDEELFEHKPFAVIADYLARHGVAALRYDDRGFDASTGLKPNTSTAENALDAKGGVEFLRTKGFGKVGIIGHSEGGLIADMLGAEKDLLDFIVEIGGPAVPGDEILLFQNKFLLEDGGMPAEYVAMYLDAMKGVFESQKGENPLPFDETKYAIFSAENASNPVLAPLAKNLHDNFVSLPAWLKSFINYDPIEDIKGINVPVLMLYGENDTQVPPALNLPVLQSQAPQVAVKTYPALNHMMQHSTTGKVTEYADIEETVSPEVLQDITAFILSLP